MNPDWKGWSANTRPLTHAEFGQQSNTMARRASDQQSLFDQLPRLRVCGPDGGPVREVPLDKDRWMIGRGDWNDLTLDHRSVSAEHAVIIRQGNRYQVRDLLSRNGTLVDGLAIDREELAERALIEIGVYQIEFVMNTAARASTHGMAPVVLEYLTGGMRGINERVDRSPKELRIAGDRFRLAWHEQGWMLDHLEGDAPVRVNDRLCGNGPLELRHDMLFDVAATRIRFRHLG
ncbi:MAG: FHA domain-containing protein [Burkholderiaceae bacterium]